MRTSICVKSWKKNQSCYTFFFCERGNSGLLLDPLLIAQLEHQFSLRSHLNFFLLLPLLAHILFSNNNNNITINGRRIIVLVNLFSEQTKN